MGILSTADRNELIALGLDQIKDNRGIWYKTLSGSTSHFTIRYVEDLGEFTAPHLEYEIDGKYNPYPLIPHHINQAEKLTINDVKKFLLKAQKIENIYTDTKRLLVKANCERINHLGDEAFIFENNVNRNQGYKITIVFDEKNGWYIGNISHSGIIPPELQGNATVEKVLTLISSIG